MNTRLKMFSHCMVGICGALAAISQQQHVPWSPRGRAEALQLAQDGLAHLLLCPTKSRQIEPALSAAHTGFWLEVMSLRFKSPAAKTLSSTEASVSDLAASPCCRGSAAAW